MENLFTERFVIVGLCFNRFTSEPDRLECRPQLPRRLLTSARDPVKRRVLIVLAFCRENLSKLPANPFSAMQDLFVRFFRGEIKKFVRILEKEGWCIWYVGFPFACERLFPGFCYVLIFGVHISTKKIFSRVCHFVVCFEDMQFCIYDNRSTNFHHL